MNQLLLVLLTAATAVAIIFAKAWWSTVRAEINDLRARVSGLEAGDQAREIREAMSK